MWKLVISSSTEEDAVAANPQQRRPTGPNVTMKTVKVCTQRLALPDGVGIIHAAPAAGHLRCVVCLTFVYQIHSGILDFGVVS